MSNKSIYYLLFTILMLLLIAKASSETIKYKKFSESECDSALGLLKL